jgi:hypothetical protein
MDAVEERPVRAAEVHHLPPVAIPAQLEVIVAHHIIVHHDVVRLRATDPDGVRESVDVGRAGQLDVNVVRHAVR